MALTTNMPTRLLPTPGQLLWVNVVTIVILSETLLNAHAVNIVRHPITFNCQDARERCDNLAPFACCSFPDIGAHSLEFQNVVSPNVVATWVPDIRSTNMCKYLLRRKEITDTTPIRLCIKGADITGGSWKAGPNAYGNNNDEDTESYEVVNPYPGLRCKSIVNATLPADHLDDEASQNPIIYLN